MIKYAHKILFSLIVFLIPINLGKHFISINSFVQQRFVDYLVPTAWLTDVLIILLVLSWFFDGGFSQVLKSPIYRLLLVFLSVFLPSVFISARSISSMFFFFELTVHIGFFLYIVSNVSVKRDFGKIVSILSISTLLLSLLAFGQWFRQGSVFNNYLFFGEQPYSEATFNVARADFGGFLRIPVYGTFRHPNVFGGFLCIVLFWIFSLLRLKNVKIVYIVAFILGFLALLLTFSQIALASLLFGMLFFVLIEKIGKRGVLCSLTVSFLILFVGLLLPFLVKSSGDPSLYRRTNLQKSAYMMIDNSPFVGVGLNGFTVELENYLPNTQVLRFVQPVHNVFLLIFAESGVFAFISFWFLLFLSVRILLNRSFGFPAVLFVSVLQIIILGSFDHYFWTILQTRVLFWLTLGLALTYTRRENVKV